MPVPKGYTLDAPTSTLPAGYTLDPPAVPGLAPGQSLPGVPAAPVPAGLQNSPTQSWFGPKGMGSLSDTASQAWNGIKGLAAPIADVAQHGPETAAYNMFVKPSVDEWLTPSQKGVMVGGTGHPTIDRIMRAAPIVGPMTANVDRINQAQGFLPAAASVVAPTVVGEFMGGLPKVPGMVKRGIAGDVTKPIPGMNVSPLQRYNAMTDMGISPDAAEATNSGPLRMVKQVNQNSLTAAPIYEDARTRNVTALNNYTGKTLDSMSPLSPEDGGVAVQKGLLRNQDALKQGATEGFKELDAQVGNNPIPGAKGVQTQAQQILDANSPYYKLHPELEPKQATAIVRDLANGGMPTKAPPKVIPGFGSAAATPPKVQRVPTYTELHRLRSDLLDFNNTNPDLVKNQANGWISQLSGAADQAITSGEGGLNPQQTSLFRQANSSWKDMKDTYDNPQSPLYHAVRSPSPSKLVTGISQTPEMARNLTNRLGPDIGPIQKGVAEKALGTTKEGNYNFRNFQGNFNKLQPEYRQSLYSAPQLQQLDNIGHAGSVLNVDVNPSGTGKLGQKIGEMSGFAGSALHPAALGANVVYHTVQNLTARAMNNPRLVSALMAPAKKGTSLTKAGGLYGAASTVPPRR